MSFLRTQVFMTSMAATSSVLDKINLLEATDFTTRRVLYWTYNKFKQFHVGPDNIRKRKDLVAETCDYSDLFDLLEDLNAREITGLGRRGKLTQLK